MAHRDLKNAQTWQQLSRETAYENPHFTVYKDECVLPSGDVGDYHVIDPGEGVFIIPQVSADEFVMIRQLRYPVQEETIEFPAGGVERGESVELTAKRELVEEAGVTAGQMTLVGEFYTEPGRSVQKLFVYVAHDLTFGEPKNDPDEEIAVIRKTRQEIAQMIANGIITDGPTLAAWTLFLNHQPQ